MFYITQTVHAPYLVYSSTTDISGTLLSDMYQWRRRLLWRKLSLHATLQMDTATGNYILHQNSVFINCKYFPHLFCICFLFLHSSASL